MLNIAASVFFCSSDLKIFGMAAGGRHHQGRQALKSQQLCCCGCRPIWPDAHQRPETGCLRFTSPCPPSSPAHAPATYAWGGVGVVPPLMLSVSMPALLTLLLLFFLLSSKRSGMKISSRMTAAAAMAMYRPGGFCM